MRDFEIIMQGENAEFIYGVNMACCNNMCGGVDCADIRCSDGSDNLCGDPMCDFDIGCDPNCGSEFAGNIVRRR